MPISPKKVEKKEAEPKKLYRSTKERWVAGICGGIAEYANIDPTIVRVLWILLSLIYGVGIILYIAMWIIVPEKK